MKIIVALSLLMLLILLILNKFKPSFLFLNLAIFYYLLGYLNFNEFASFYMNNSSIILILLLIISLAIEKTSFISYCSKFIIDKNYKFSLFKLCTISAFVSSFLNNTAVVASFISIIKNNKFHNPSKLLIPLSYSAIVGGTMTLIGTSTNLIVNSFVMQNNLPSLKIFDFFIIGFCTSIFVIFTIIIFSNLLPNIKTKIENINKHLIYAKVLKNSSLIGKSISENKLRNLKYLFLIQIKREEKIISCVNPNEIIKENDILVFSGDISYINILNKFDGLFIDKNVKNNDFKIFEVLIKQESNLVNKTIKQANFRSKFNASIISIFKNGKNLSANGDSILELGDKLILTCGDDFLKRDNIDKNFYIISKINQKKILNNFQNIFVIFGFISIIFLSVLNFISFLKSLIIFLILLVLFKIVNFNEIKRRFNFDIFVIIGSSLAIAKVLSYSNLTNDFAKIVINLFGDFGVYGVFIGIYLLTLILTEFITNNAAAALMFPMAYASAISLNVNIYPFIFAVAFGASCSFIIPYGYQTNLMINSICEYKMKDFVKIGSVVSFVYSLSVIILIPFIFKF